MNIFFQSQCKALERAFEERTCPPDNLLRSHDSRIEAHLKACAHCREKAVDFIDGSMLRRFIPTPGTESVHVGDIRRVSSKWASDTYGADGWHRPPIVLVLEEKGEGQVLVAQVHRYPELAVREDVALGDMADAWAEPWNTWIMPASHLNRCLARGSAEECELVIKKSADSLDPETRTNPRTGCFARRGETLELGGVINTFHALERRTGAFYRNLGLQSAQSRSFPFIAREWPKLAREHATDERTLMAAAAAPDTSLSRLAVFAGLSPSTDTKLPQRADVHYCDKDGTVLRTESYPASLQAIQEENGRKIIACIPWKGTLPVATVIWGSRHEGLLTDESAIRRGELTFACHFSNADFESEDTLRAAVFVDAENPS